MRMVDSRVVTFRTASRVSADVHPTSSVFAVCQTQILNVPTSRINVREQEFSAEMSSSASLNALQVACTLQVHQLQRVDGAIPRDTRYLAAYNLSVGDYPFTGNESVYTYVAVHMHTGC